MNQTTRFPDTTLVPRPGPFLLSLVVPVFNEEDAIVPFLETTSRVLADYDVEYVFVNDGSRDGTLHKLLLLQAHYPRMRIVELSRNFGKEAALTAGLNEARGDAVVPIDVDLQDPPELIPEMIRLWRQGFDVVLARRSSRDTDSFAKRLTAAWFYRLHNQVSEIEIPENVGDFRLMDRAVVQVLASLKENRRFMKGIFAWAGFRTTSLEFRRQPRTAGTTKFNGWRLWNFALEGITSFSTAPLRVWTYVGVLVAVVSSLFGLGIVARVLLFGVDLPGYASVVTAVAFLGSLQLVGVGVLGEYIGRTYMESKGRPSYVIRRVYLQDEENEIGSEGSRDSREWRRESLVLR